MTIIDLDFKELQLNSAVQNQSTFKFLTDEHTAWTTLGNIPTYGKINYRETEEMTQIKPKYIPYRSSHCAWDYSLQTPTFKLHDWYKGIQIS